MQVVRCVLARAGLEAPDGRPLHGYGCSKAEREQLKRDLQIRLRAAHLLRDQPTAAPSFVLWAAEHIRSQYQNGHLTWRFLFSSLGLPENRELGVRLVEWGLQWWRRKIRKSAAGHQLFLYSLLAEGGIPDAMLAQASRYQTVLLAMLRDIELDGALGGAVLEQIAKRYVSSLPQVFQNEETARLLAELAGTLANLRRRVPEDLPPLAVEAWLDAQPWGWRAELPVRLSPEALSALIRPALAAPRNRPPAGPFVRRELRRRSDGKGWAGYAVLTDGALLPAAFLPDVPKELRLRLFPRLERGAGSVSFFGVPEEGGWRLSRVGQQGEVALALPPDEAVVVSAHADGRLVGEAVIDAGLPAPAEAPSLWAAVDPAEPEVTRLRPLSGIGRTRGAAIWLLAPEGAKPESSPGLAQEPPEPAPGGRIWRLSGEGWVTVAGERLRIMTHANEEDEAARLHVVGSALRGWRAAQGVQVFCGAVSYWGATGAGTLVSLKNKIAKRPLPRLLGGYIAEWRHDGEVLARLRLVSLPEGLGLKLRETIPGTIALSADGLRVGWHVRLIAGEAEARAAAANDGQLTLSLTVPGQPPGHVQLRLSDPNAGAALDLEAPWPTRTGTLIDPDGRRLVRNRQISLGALAGWRGIVPEAGGTLELEVQGTRVGLRVSGELRLAAYEPLLRGVLAHAGPDARVNLRLIVDGDEGARLELGQYDWEAALDGPLCRLGAGRTYLHAVMLSNPNEVKTTNAEGEINLLDWLGLGTQLWFVQGRSDQRGTMRPFVWSSVSGPPSNRDERVSIYADEWQRLLANLGDPAWDLLWKLIRKARAEGDAGALHQVQAIGRMPAAAIALVLNVPSSELAEALDLEDAAPLWWPLTKVSDWKRVVSAEHARLRARLSKAGFDEANAKEYAAQQLAQRAGAILAIRPELRGHLARAFHACGLPPFALSGHPHEPPHPLRSDRPQERLETLAREAARRFEGLPDGTGRISAKCLQVGADLNPDLRPLLHAPLIVAEVAAGLRGAPDIRCVLQVMALRLADPVWFDDALPHALQLAGEIFDHG